MTLKDDDISPRPCLNPRRDLRRRILIATYLPSLLAGMGLGAVLPVLPSTALDYGASSADAAWIMSMIMFGSLLASLPASVLTARLGERPCLVGAALLQAVAVAGLIHDPSLPLIAAAALALGIGQSVFALARQTYLVDAIPVAIRARALSTLGGVLRMGMFAGPLCGSALIILHGRTAVYVAATTVLVIAAATCWLLPTPTGRDDSPLPVTTLRTVLYGDRRFFATIGFGIALLAAVRGSRQVVLPLWAEHCGLDAATTSLIISLSWAVDVLLFYPGGWLMDHYGRRATALPTTFGMALAFAALPWTQDALGVAAVGILVALSNGFGSGLVMTITADASPAQGRPQFLGISRFLGDLGAAGGPALLSLMTGLLSLTAGVWCIVALAVGAGMVFAHYLPRRTSA
ncbi:hypothetical protein KEM60_01039 [Austwickia sp. TVS 96-490-7B]|uniref:MFS transporter n=1 Tax=Austwickia sp. TVS 96-490-7B TaxID=2830843 RepID=UPI001C56C635|nr:MFS transporter [Austwickia sp. TVS 96-490-7B]MBW3084850.1 hypothetical protein [Austwickia sp. TVS 96-490-7B]